MEPVLAPCSVPTLAARAPLRKASASRLTKHLLIQKLRPAQQVGHDGAPGADGVVRIGHLAARSVLVRRGPAVVALLLLNALLFLRVVDDASEQFVSALDFGAVLGIVAAEDRLVQLRDRLANGFIA